jgi:aspartate/methionine/tyrosine aminotransferase
MTATILRSIFLSSLALKSQAFLPQISISSARAPIGLKMSTSAKVQETLDPCVVLMKQMIAQYEPDWKERGGIFSLAQGVVYWEPPNTVTTSLQEAVLTNTLHLYGPDEGLPELLEAIESKLATENDLSNHRVMVTAGANQAFMNCILTLLGDGDECVFFRPYYFNHIMATQLAVGDAGVKLGECNYEGVPDLGWLETELSSNPSIKAVTLTNPGNPTGVNLEREVLQRLVDLCKLHNKWLILDCTYEHFQHNRDDATKFSCFEDPHVIHIFSFSKGFALAGYRCGYVVVSKESNEMYEQMRKVQDTIPICTSRFSQHAALGALSAGRGWVNAKVETLSAGRAAIVDALSPLEQVMGGSGAMYVMGKLPTQNNNDQEVARSLVKDYGVAVIPGTFCGSPGWIRVCYSNLAPEQCVEAAGRLAIGIKDLCQ